MGMLIQALPLLPSDGSTGVVTKLQPASADRSSAPLQFAEGKKDSIQNIIFKN